VLKVIIVDDEKRICQLIRRLIDWESIGLEVVAEASDGNSAYNLIYAIKPDIVISDIRMPGMDGLEMIERLRSVDITPSFILISGHKQFKYAHNAIKQGVENYLLKPINRQELLENLISIRDQILEKKGDLEEKILIKNKLELSVSKVRKQMIEILLATPEIITSLHLEEINKEYMMNLKPGYFQFAVLKAEKKQELQPEQNEKETKKMEAVFNKEMGGICFDMESYRTKREIVFLLNHEDYEIFIAQLKQTYSELQTRFSDYFMITIGLSNRYSNFEKAAVQESFTAIRYALITGKEHIIDIAKIQVTNRVVLTEEINRDLRQLFAISDLEGIKEYFTKLRIQYLQGEINPENMYKEMLIIIDLLLASMKVLYKNEKLNVSREDIIDKMEQSNTIAELFDITQDEVCRLVADYINLRSTKDTRYIRTAKQYVAEHYSKNINLEDIAEQVHMNSVYFSVMFKKETNINFSDYLVDFRLTKAKELLKNYSISISEVGALVGYKDPRYFSKLFNKIVGIKPSDYRKLFT